MSGCGREETHVGVVSLVKGSGWVGMCREGLKGNTLGKVGLDETAVRAWEGSLETVRVGVSGR